MFEAEDKLRKRTRKSEKKKEVVTQEDEEQFKLEKEQEDLFYETALQRLIKERRRIPKDDRIKMRQDSVDEIDTTDLENWVFRPNFHLVDHFNAFKEQ